MRPLFPHARRVLAALLVSCIVVALLPAPGHPVAAQARPKPKVLTTFTILADMARHVAGDHMEIESITRPGAEIHDYEPTPGDIAKAQTADLLLLNGFGLERWFERFYQEVSGVPRVTLTAGITPIPIVDGAYAGEANPHAWMSPRNALVYVENIRQAFSELDPANAAIYQANATAYAAEITRVSQLLDNGLGQLPENERALVTCEGAFSYLARDFNLREGYLWAVNAENEGTPQQVAQVITMVRETRIPAVFCESTVAPDAMERVAIETGVRFGGVLYVDSLTGEDGAAPTYLALLETDATTIVTGLTGRPPDGATPPAN